MRITGFPREAVKVNTMLLGGGFGRRGEQDLVADAVETSKAVNARSRSSGREKMTPGTVTTGRQPTTFFALRSMSAARRLPGCTGSSLRR